MYQPLFLNIFFLNLTTATLTCNLYHLNLSTPHVIQSEKPGSLYLSIYSVAGTLEPHGLNRRDEL